ncbi:MAG TPA: polysaccharide deacetylase family protein [Ignavibacteria bacterium]|nr:polysaccharide deacetylase family protein [Ignavibacteria bacterium]
MKRIAVVMLLLFLQCLVRSQDKPSISITIDDPHVNDAVIWDWQQKDDSLLSTLDKYGVKAALFVCGMRVDSPEGRQLLGKWNSRGHLICNHSYSHKYYHSKKLSLEDFEYDFLRSDSIINEYTGFTKLFRYPYLKEGNTIEKRDGFRHFMDSLGYRNGYVTVDASDWYIDGRMSDTLKYYRNFDTTPFLQYYLEHIYNRAMYYDSLGLALTGRHIKHTLLLHHNLLNAMFLGELLKMFKAKGWELTDAVTAFNDEVFALKPDILPAGESLVWAMAKQSGNYESSLRYPAEDGEYEEEGLNNKLKNYFK